jgi:hypothetical protein
MAPVVVSIICIALIILGGMMMSQGILTSADTTAVSVEEISDRESEITRTDITALRASYLSWSDLLRVTVANDGQTKLASYDKWDCIARYYDATAAYHAEWLPFTSGNLSANQWQKARIGLNGPTEYFEPGILNPQEELVLLASLSPLPGDATSGDITIATPNGVYDSIVFTNPGYTLLTPHSENTTLAGTDYYQLEEAIPADGTAATFSEEYANGETGRKILYNAADPSRQARHCFSLVGIEEIPEATWTVYYRCYVWGGGGFPTVDGDVRFNIDVLVRQADGTVRDVIDDVVAVALVNEGEEGYWMTKSATYDFPGYSVINENDYLEIDFYVQTNAGPEGAYGYVQLRVDDSTVSENQRTRITG